MSAPHNVPSSGKRGRTLFLSIAVVGVVALAALFFPAWKSNDNVVRILPLFASINLDTMGTPSHDGRFVPYRNNKAELMVYNIATKESHRVLDHPADVRRNFQQFILSPDGSQVAYLLESLDGPGQLRVLNADGSGDRLLFTDPKYLLVTPTSWSADGKSIAAVLTGRLDTTSIAVIDVSSGALRVLYGGKSVSNAQFSPDGRFIAYAQNGEIFVVPSAGGPPMAAVSDPSDDRLIGWAPDGRLAFSSDRSGTRDIWTLEFHDGKITEAPKPLWKNFSAYPLGITTGGDLLYNRSEIRNGLYSADLDASGQPVAPPVGTGDERFDGNNRAPDYSPDGKSLAYVSGIKDSPTPGIHIRNLVTHAERELPLPMPQVDQIRWYPDGRAILIRGGGSNHYGFFRLAVDKPQEPTPVLTEGVGMYPAVNPTFSPDGKYLYYLALPSPDTAALMRLDLATGTRKEVLRPKQGFLRLFAISRDGTQILFDARPPGSSRDQIYLAPLSGGQPKLLTEVDSIRAFGGLAWADTKAAFFHRPDPYGLRMDDLLRLPLDGSPPAKLASAGALIRIAVHPDGRRITWESQEWRDELLSVHNLFINNPIFQQHQEQQK